MQVGDLVKIVNAWTGYNDWMEFPNDTIKIGLVIEVWQDRRAIVLVQGERKVIPQRELVVL